MKKEKTIYRQYDVNSPEWKKKIEDLGKQLDKRDGTLRHELFSIGYTKNLSKSSREKGDD